MIQSLQQSVQSVIDEGRIGSPVFLRCIVHAPIEAVDTVGGIAALTAIANSWMPDPPEQLYALDNADKTQITAMVKYAGGQSALLSVNRLPVDGEVTVDLRLVGNNGIIYHETPTGPYRLMNPPLDFGGGAALIDTIRQGLETKQPISVTEG
ncbi:hypothetical protein J4G02_10795 [Candidatus Poribacteria bacterium]|nr:hypothetical protein [Candidatus Poribacteria bacterium]